MILSSEAVESMLKAMEIVSSAQLNNVSYDQTIICTIIDNSHAEKESYYTVSDGRAKFKAYVTTNEDMKKYKIDDQVYVKIPKGDYTQQKIIEGYYVSEKDIVPVTYVSPLDSFLDMSELTADSNGDKINIRAGLVANGEKKEIPIWQWQINKSKDSVDDLQNNGIYDTIGLQASFKSLLDAYNIKSGSYGLRLDLYVRLTPTSNKHSQQSIYFDSSEMFGNPYSFTIYTPQSKVVDISKLGIIDGMTLFLYQNNDFTYYDGVKLERLKKELTNNILVTDIFVSFGSNVSVVEDNIVKLYTTEDTSFNYISPNDSTNKKQLGFLWYNKTEENKYIGFSDGRVEIDNNGKIIPYDELKYLEKKESEERLQRQLAKTIPTDKNGLTISANVEEGSAVFKDISNLIGTELMNTLIDFKNRTKSLDKIGKDKVSSEIYFDGDTGKSKKCKEYLENFNKNYTSLLNWYNDALSAAADIQKHQTENTLPTTVKVIDIPAKTYKNIYDDYTDFKKIYYNGTVIFKELRETIRDKFPSFQSIYDTYTLKLDKTFKKINDKFVLLNSLLRNNEKKITSNNIHQGEQKDEDGNKPTYNESIEQDYIYTLNKTITPYEPEDFSQDDNKYCVYWYRYEKGYVDEEGLMEDGWKRLKPGDKIQYNVINTKDMISNLGLPTSYEDIDGINYLTTKPDPAKSFLTVYLNPNKQEEKFKVVLFYNHEKFISNELIFTNKDQIVDATTFDSASAIKIVHGENSHESYQTLYGANQSLVNFNQTYVDRKLHLEYSGLLSDKTVLADATIYWYVPRNKTMLKIDPSKLITKKDDDGKFNSDFYRSAKVKKDIKIYQGPGDNYPVVGEGFKKGDIISNIYDQSNNWYSLRESNPIGKTGRWINEEGITLIENKDIFMKGYACFYKKIKAKKENDEITIEPEELTFEYQIEDYYTESASNNTIFCIVKKDGYTFETSISMTFGTLGTSGTDYTISIKPLTSESSIIGTYDEKGKPVHSILELSLKAFDYNNIEIPIYKNSDASLDSSHLYNPQIKWRGPTVYNMALFSNDDDDLQNNPLSINSAEATAADIQKYTYTNGSYTIDYYNCCGIAEVVTSLHDSRYGSKKELTVLYPVPWSSGKYHLEGATSVIYDSFGANPAYYKDPYRLFNDKGEEQTKVRWDIHYIIEKDNIKYLVKDGFIDGGSAVGLQVYKLENNIAKKLKESDSDEKLKNLFKEIKFNLNCAPKLDKLNQLIPCNMYIGETRDESGKVEYLNFYPIVSCYDSTNKLLWAQPIIVIQNRYPNAMVNSWDGKFMIDEDNETILANMLGAGYKNTDNTYSGVLMGVVDGVENKSNRAEVGIYGFNHGAQSFGLNIDGTAFFGKSGRGRIEIDGNTGIIRSAGWKWDTENIEKKGWLLTQPSGTLLDLDDGMLLMEGKNGYLYFNKDESGLLEMSLPGANIHLIDKDGKGLSGYIDATAKGLVTEFRRTAIYAVTCDTKDSSNKNGSSTKKLNLEDFTKNYFFENNTPTDNDLKVESLTVNDIQQDGVTIAVTFTYPETVTTEQVDIITTKIGEEEKIIGYKEKHTGKALQLQIDKNDAIPIFVNAKATNNIPSLDDKNEIDKDSNSYGWNAGSTIYFTYKETTKDNGHWEVSDSGSYSKITQTADMIKSEVSNISGTLSSSITQTAGEIKTEVARKANYNCTCETISEKSPKYIRIAEYNEIPKDLKSGFTISVTFENENAVTENLKFSLCDSDATTSRHQNIPVDGSPIWEKRETLSFVYNGESFVLTSLSHSSITQTADKIIAEVSNIERELSASIELEAGKIKSEVNDIKKDLSSSITQTADAIEAKVSKEGGQKGFSWELLDDKFSLYSTVENESIEVFKCDSSGIEVKGAAKFAGKLIAASGTFNGNLTANTTTFNQLEVSGKSSILDPNYILRTYIHSDGAFFDAEYKKGNYRYHGQLRIGRPEGDADTWNDLTITPYYVNTNNKTESSREPTIAKYYGNLGSTERRWDWIGTRELWYLTLGGQSTRSVKENIEMYNTNQAYDELKNLPLYTFRYKSSPDKGMRTIGTMIDYMPIETMHVNGFEDGSVYNLNSIIFWHIGASQVMQKKIEDLENQIKNLQEVINNGSY